MDLQTLWFILITILFTGFFLLEGFDYGVGILLPFIGKNDKERRVVINSIGPVWDANEVWLLTAGGAMFAAFPHWYATMFSGFYLALFVILVGLIVRGVAFEFRSKDMNTTWRKTWDFAIFIGSLLPAILFGVAFANVVRGLTIDENMIYTGTFFDLLNVYSLVGGLATFALFTLHGAVFLELKTDGVIRERAKAVSRIFWFIALGVVVLFVILSLIDTNMFAEIRPIPVIALGIAVVALLFAGYNIVIKGNYLQAFLGTSLTLIGVVVLLFSTLYPNVMPSSTNPAFSLTIYNASSSDYTLSIMTVIALTFVPIVLVYQAWTYWVFRKRLTIESKLEY